MQSKNRSLRVTALAHTFGMLRQAVLNPYTTMADADRLGAELRVAINAVLDSEYKQGYEDGAFFGANVATEIFNEEQR